MTEIHLESRDGKAVRIRAEEIAGGYRLEIDGREREVRIHRARDGAIELECAGRPIRGSVAGREDQRIVQVFGREPLLLARVDPRRKKGRPRAAHEEALTASMHAQVAAVLVAEGDAVAAGATLVVLEAMKMELRVTAHHAGRVKRLACKLGETVERGRVLVELEPVAP